MPLSKIQIDVLRLLAAHRDPESYVAGATPLNRDAPRYSGDIDIFHDRQERVASAALSDAQAIAAAGYAVRWLRQLPLMYTAEVTREGASTRLEWVADSDYRFFPTMQDELFGYVLHPVDLAMNKVMAAAGRRELRDIVDLVMIHETILPLGATVWAGRKITGLHARRVDCRDSAQLQLPGCRMAGAAVERTARPQRTSWRGFGRRWSRY